MDEMRTCPKCGNETPAKWTWCAVCHKQTGKNTQDNCCEELKKAAAKIVEIKEWCKELNVKYNNYETALNERIDDLAQILGKQGD